MALFSRFVSNDVQVVQRDLLPVIGGRGGARLNTYIVSIGKTTACCSDIMIVEKVEMLFRRMHSSLVVADGVVYLGHEEF